MDVRCTRCGIEYEFDDAKVTAAGITVKCTSCGHVFKVKREEPVAATAPPGMLGIPSAANPFSAQSTFVRGMDGNDWMVKRTDGQVFRFKELTTLQKWIVERKVGRDDEISKTGKTWKRLGEIAELASFFQVVDAANAALQASIAPVAPAMPAPNIVQGIVVTPSTSPGVPAVSTATTQSSPPGLRGVPPTGGGAGPTDPRAAFAEPAITGGSGRSMPAPGDAAPPAPAAPAVPIARRAAGAPEPDALDALDALDGDDPVLQMFRRRRRNAALVVALLVVVAAGAVTGALWPQIAPRLGLAAPPAQSPLVDEARKAVRADSLEGLRAARTALAQSTASTSGSASGSAAGPKRDPRVLAWQARLDVALASHAREEARLADQLARPPAAAASAAENSARAARLREEAGASLATAYAALAQVRAEAPRLVDGHLASAAYQLEKGGFSELRADLESARTHAAGDANVDAEIAALQALADAVQGLSADPAAALARVPAGTDDGRLRYQRAALAVAVPAQRAPAPETDGGAARSAARTVVEGLPGPDARAEALLAILAALEPPPPPPPEVVDAGPAAADAGPDAAATGSIASTMPPTEDREPNAIEAASYDVIMQKAERALVNDQSRTAFELFTRATKLKPSAPRPWLKLGWAALDLNKHADAIRAFHRALLLDEGLSDAQFGLAEAYNFSGRKAQALEAYRTYLKMDPNGKDAAVARRAIKSLE
jgi:predicted Zn finger-like uncharacterized protein